MSLSLLDYVKQKAARAKAASALVAHLDTAVKNRYLEALAAALVAETSAILVENAKDIQTAESRALSLAMIDRLRLSEARIADMAQAVLAVAKLSDPVGQVVEAWTRPNGLQVSRVRIPLGSIAMIYESRPNVTVDAAVLCFKSGNAIVLRGGSEAIFSNRALVEILSRTAHSQGLPPDWVQFIDVPDRDAIPILVQQVGAVDLVIPRGGEGLMRFIDAHARVPVLKHDKGVCSIYIDKAADREKAKAIVLNAKVSRPGVCNAVENLWVHESQKDDLPDLISALEAEGVKVKGDAAVRQLVPVVEPASEGDWTTEYLDLTLSIGVVPSLDAAISRIRETSSLHTEAIVTEDGDRAERFLKALDSSCVLWNASTRFNDGGELGLGAEIGISTTKLHAFGPMGLQELTATKFVVRGTGQVRT